MLELNWRDERRFGSSIDQKLLLPPSNLESIETVGHRDQVVGSSEKRILVSLPALLFQKFERERSRVDVKERHVYLSFL